jgi:hypothetical protein
VVGGALDPTAPELLRDPAGLVVGDRVGVHTTADASDMDRGAQVERPPLPVHRVADQGVGLPSSPGRGLRCSDVWARAEMLIEVQETPQQPT